MVDSIEAEVDIIEKVEDLTILCKIRENMNGKVMTKARLDGKVVILTEEVVVPTKEEAILTLEEAFVVIVLDVAKKGIDSLSVDNLVTMTKVTKMM